MNQIERRDRQMPYLSDQTICEQQLPARRLTQKLNTVDRADFEAIEKIVKELLGRSDGAFHCG